MIRAALHTAWPTATVVAFLALTLLLVTVHPVAGLALVVVGAVVLGILVSRRPAA
jgi:energy-coupling factor transporter transmembrane protein EcfT